MAQPCDQHEVLATGQDLVDRSELAGEADRLAHLRGIRGHVEAVDGRGAGIGREQGRQGFDDRRLACPVGAEKGDDGAALDVEVDTAQHVQLLVRLLEPGDVDGGGRGGRHLFSALSASSIAAVRRARSLSIQWVPE